MDAERLAEIRARHAPQHGYACWTCRDPEPCDIPELLDHITRLTADLARRTEERDQARDECAEWERVHRLSSASECAALTERDEARAAMTSALADLERRDEISAMDTLRAALGQLAAGGEAPPALISPWQCSVCREMVPESQHVDHMQAHVLQRTRGSKGGDASDSGA